VYQYRAWVIRVIDGDTAEVRVDLGFKVGITATLRLHGIDAPELKGETLKAGKAARARLREVVEGKEVVIDSRELDKYGRTVAVVLLDGVNVNELLVSEGHAAPYVP